MKVLNDLKADVAGGDREADGETTDLGGTMEEVDR